jgi:hypothetical protein
MGVGVFVLDYMGKRFYLPSSTLPRYCPNISASTKLQVAVEIPVSTNAFYVRVTLPGGTEVTTTLTDKTVDGLKEAVLKFSAKLKDKDVGDLKVYPPGKAKAKRGSVRQDVDATGGSVGGTVPCRCFVVGKSF